ncbi:hypothetical protein HIM_02393 [Hirsutella minnesotensis 3608]|nr:hypothetical protein HIM_02393 [Hirsutella minnesotensis 3608]
MGLKGRTLEWVQISMLVASIVFTGLRVYVRAYMARSFTPDDWVILLATVMFVVSLSVGLHGTTAGAFGHEDHDYDHPDDDHLEVDGYRETLKGIFFCEVLYIPITLAIRVSVCLFLLRIVNRKVHRQLIYALLALVSTASLAYLLVTIFQCMPPSHFWAQAQDNGSDGSCAHQDLMTAMGFVHGSVSALSAAFVGLLPVVILWRIRLDLRTKVTVLALLGMSFVHTALWSIIEPGVGLVAASLPTLRPLFKKLTPKSAGTEREPAPAHRPGHRRSVNGSRTIEVKPQWVELTTHDGTDRDAEKPQTREYRSQSTASQDYIMWNAHVERGDAFERPPPVGITIRTAIEVTSEPRDSIDS